MAMSSACQQSNHATNYRRILSNRTHSLQKVDHLALIMSFQRGQEICGQGQPADYWYFVVSGAARCCVFRPDGRRQIVGLVLADDFFGFIPGEEYDFSVEAIAKETVVAAYPRRRVEAAADSDAYLARQIRRIAFDAISRLQSHLLILGRITAPEKVGSFILEMAMRSSRGNTDSVTLPITRYDIAEYLAVSVETVSRSLTNLKQRGLIKMSGTRKIRIIDRDALEKCEGPSVGLSTELSYRRPNPDVRPASASSPAPQYGLPRQIAARPTASSSVTDAPRRCAR
jgi:CRP/FNR family transcriptional regulator, nitrogen fixation regulation protein